MQSFMAVGSALLTIRKRWIYREGFKTFEDYYRWRWGMGKSYAGYLISWCKVVCIIILMLGRFSQGNGSSQGPHLPFKLGAFMRPVLRSTLGLPLLPAGKFGQEKGDRTPCEFLNPFYFWRQHRPALRLWPCSADIQTISNIFK